MQFKVFKKNQFGIVTKLKITATKILHVELGQKSPTNAAQFLFVQIETCLAIRKQVAPLNLNLV